MVHPHNPLIVQSDGTVMVEVASPRYEEVRGELARFAELVKSPEHIHTYRLSPLSLWNAASVGMTVEEVVQTLEGFSKYPVPANVLVEVREMMGRHGALVLLRERGGERRLLLQSRDPLLLDELSGLKSIRPYLGPRLSAHALVVHDMRRGSIKQALIHLGWPVDDRAGYTEGAPLEIGLRSVTRAGFPFALRAYQRDAVEVFHAGGSARGGSGIVVLPCGAGKTIVGLGALARIGRHCLILTTSVVAVRQWRRELLDKTTLTEAEVGEYTGDVKQIRPVTVATYQVVTSRRGGSSTFPNFKLFTEQDWGLIIYDEVHLLPAPVFRVTADIQARRRLGLTATLVREDNAESDVFALIGPKKYDVPWRDLERQGWIAAARCEEIRVALPRAERRRYAMAEQRTKFRIASENPAKDRVVLWLAETHKDDQVLIIGQYLRQLRRLAAQLGAPCITGQTPNRERERLYELFRRGEIKVLVVSKVANFAVDLPDANVAIQVSGTFGSRQEEAQRLGRLLRPKRGGGGASFFSVVTKETRDQEFSARRQRFLTEQGYVYTITEAPPTLRDEEDSGGPVPLLTVIDGGKP